MRKNSIWHLDPWKSPERYVKIFLPIYFHEPNICRKLHQNSMHYVQVRFLRGRRRLMRFSKHYYLRRFIFLFISYRMIFYDIYKITTFEIDFYYRISGSGGRSPPCRKNVSISSSRKDPNKN
jgi:hypothetical protein